MTVQKTTLAWVFPNMDLLFTSWSSKNLRCALLVPLCHRGCRNSLATDHWPTPQPRVPLQSHSNLPVEKYSMVRGQSWNSHDWNKGSTHKWWVNRILIAAFSKPFFYSKRKAWISKAYVEYLTFTSGNEKRGYFTACKTNPPNCISE